ncbi:response regulator [Paenibacillus koleovorans]|uniref:response regulator n=1 Tax=Paenibacillus koleovorans TaxID=121608 RepID=UPI000FD8BB70|nr:response regulator [Paenibacillus koleovorans]
MKAIIVDDEQPSIDMLKILLEEDGRVEVTGTYRKPAEALAMLDKLKPDVVFLDIQMPLMNGLELAELMLDAHDELEIIFVTAYDHYALDAFQASAIDYLLKPIAEAGLDRAISRLFKRKRTVVPNPASLQPHVYIHCLGRLEVTVRESAHVPALRTTKAQELLAYLYLKRDKEVSKWEIIEDIWPECSKEQAHSHLHTTVYQVRKLLKQQGIHAALSFRNAHYRLNAAGLASDLALFSRAFDKEIRITAANAPYYEQCLDLYQGDLFGVWSYAWSLPAREKLREQYASLTKQLCRFYLQSEDYSPAMLRMQGLIAVQPLDEEAYELLLQLDWKRNDRTAFVAHYRQLEQVLHTELGLVPNETTRRLYEEWFAAADEER